VTTRTPILFSDDQNKKGVLPEMQHLKDNSGTEWLPTYIDGMFRAHFQTATFQISTGISDGLVFLHQIRRVRNSCRHTADEDTTTDAELFFEKHQLEPQEILNSDAQFQIDIGFEIQSDEYNDCQRLSWLAHRFQLPSGTHYFWNTWELHLMYHFYARQ
jgi:hypothetical protein